MKAWAITVDGFDPCVACAASRSKAVHAAWSSAQGAGYHSVTWIKIRAKRLPKLDAWAAKQPQACFTMAHAETEAQRMAA